MKEILCDCGKHVGNINYKEKKINLTEEVIYNTLNKNRMVAECPHCGHKISVNKTVIVV